MISILALALFGLTLPLTPICTRQVGIFIGIMNTDFASLARSESVYAATGSQI